MPQIALTLVYGTPIPGFWVGIHGSRGPWIVLFIIYILSGIGLSLFDAVFPQKPLRFRSINNSYCRKRAGGISNLPWAKVQLS